MSNKRIGSRFEAELCSLLADKGFWSHNLAQNETGQPADVIAVKNDTAVLIDCKVCANDRFPLSRIEGNQEGAMLLWEQKGNSEAYFAMKLSDGSIYMVPFDELQLLHLFGTVAIADFTPYPTFEQWVRRFDNVYCIR